MHDLIPPSSIPNCFWISNPHPTSQIKTFNIIAPILMDTQHTSFIQPQFLISHYQFLLNSTQPFRRARTAREAPLTRYAKRGFVCLSACSCARSMSESWPKSSLSSWQRQSSTPEEGWPRLSLISLSREEHWRAKYGLHQRKQVTSSYFSTAWIYSNNKGCWNLQVVWWGADLSGQMRCTCPFQGVTVTKNICCTISHWILKYHTKN